MMIQEEVERTKSDYRIGLMELFMYSTIYFMVVLLPGYATRNYMLIFIVVLIAVQLLYLLGLTLVFRFNYLFKINIDTPIMFKYLNRALLLSKFLVCLNILKYLSITTILVFSFYIEKFLN